MMLPLLLCACLAHASVAQSYAERNILPADVFPTPKTDVYDYNYAEGYGFDEQEGPDVYRWNVEEYPHPRNSSRFCNRLKASNVCDPDMILTKEHADYLDASIRKLYEKTPCICDSCGDDENGGIVVGIALLKHMYLPYNIHQVQAIRSFAETLRRHWRLGKCDNDILIVIATEDRLSYTDVGQSTSSYLSIQEAHRIFVANKAKFTAANFFEGLRDILLEYQTQTRTMSSPVRSKEGHADVGLISGVIVGCIALMGISAFVGFAVCRKCRLNKIEREQDPENLKREGFISRSWSKRDIKVRFGSEKRKTPPPFMTQYQPCQAEVNEPQSPEDGEEVIDFRLAVPHDIEKEASDSEAMGVDLSTAAEGIANTFPASSRNNVTVAET